MTKQMPLMKPSAHKREVQQRNSLGTVSKKTAGWRGCEGVGGGSLNLSLISDAGQNYVNVFCLSFQELFIS